MKDILQEWSDENASHILDNLYNVIRSGSRLLVIETVLHTGSHSEERVSKMLNCDHAISVYDISLKGRKSRPRGFTRADLMFPQKSTM